MMNCRHTIENEIRPEDKKFADEFIREHRAANGLEQRCRSRK